MRHLNLGLAVPAVLAVSAIMASAAQAKEPIYSVAGSTAFGSANVDSTNVGNYTLTAGTIVITCTVAKTEPGAKIKEKGLNAETLKFEGCTVAGNGTSCTNITGPGPAGTITTEALKSKLVVIGKETNEANKIGNLFEGPVVGGAKIFVSKIDFGPTGCTFTTTKVTGEVIGEVIRKDKTTAVICKDALKEELEGFVNFPSPRIDTYKTECKAGAATAVKPINVFGKAATLQGKSNVIVTGPQNWGILPQ